MTITQLKYILAVAECQNFTQASEKCFVTQPTLSMQIHKLEQELGITIFDRNKKPIQVTQVGKKIVEQAQNIVNEAKRMEDVVAQEKGFIGGDFLLGIIPTITPTLLPMFLTNFINRYPQVKLNIIEQNTQTIIENLEKGKLDAAIVATPLEISTLVEKPLYYEPFVAYIPQGHHLYNSSKMDPSMLSGEHILTLEDGHCFTESVLNICGRDSVSKTDHFQIKSGSFETLIRLCNEGLGMTLLPYLHAMGLPSSEKENIRQFKDPSPSREISLIYHQNGLKLPIIEALHKVILGVVRGAIYFENVKIISPKRN